MKFSLGRYQEIDGVLGGKPQIHKQDYTISWLIAARTGTVLGSLVCIKTR